MATRETLISDLPPPQSGGGEQNLVQNIIQEYETVSSQPSGRGGGVEGFQGGGPMGGVQNPLSQNELVSQDQFTDMQRSAQQQQLSPPPLGGSQQQMPPLRGAAPGVEQFHNQGQQYADDGEYYEEVIDEQLPLTTSQLIYYHVRLPVLVAILVYLSNMRLINLYMIKYIPKMANRLGGLSQLGMVVKSVLFAVVFYLVATFLLK